MKGRISYILVFLMISGSIFAQKSKLPKNRLDSVSYAVGVSMFEETMKFRMKFNYDMVAAGLIAAKDSVAIMDLESANMYISRVYQQAARTEMLETMEIGQKFLDLNQEVEGIKVTQSGLQFRVIKQGSGPIPTLENKVKVNYKGYLLDGFVFDSSFDRGAPAVFRVNSIIEGWIEALTMMPVGSEYVIYVPPHLAYGDRQTGDYIKPGSTLIFEIQLLEIVE